jgi:indolepyruvate ferredoxin oxidoreductase
VAVVTIRLLCEAERHERPRHRADRRGTRRLMSDVLVPGPPPAAPSLQDKYLADEGEVFLTGVQAIVRALLDGRRADRRAGLRTATFVSGYQGSPLGTFDSELARLKELKDEFDIVHVPGLNEELAATSVWGSQIAPALPDARYDGVVGVWYGKAPGLDRAGDAIRHANFVGTSGTGGVLALTGDDPSAKSSTLPGHSDLALADLGLPTLSPGSLQDVIDLGLHGVALSRASGLWTALKIVTNVADGHGTAYVGPDRVAPILPTVEYDGRPYVHTPDARIVPPATIEMERSLFGVRMQIAREYARLNGLNRVEVDPADAWIGILAAGKTYADVRQALAELGLDDTELRRAGVRLLKLGMTYPLEPQIVRTFARGLREILVVEDKRPFLESAVRDVLYELAERPRVVGRHDEHGAPLLPTAGELTPDAIAPVLAARIGARVSTDAMQARLAAIDAARAAVALPVLRPSPAGAPPVVRTPFFCSGCPHNTSTKAPEDALVGGGIGCHLMAMHAPKGAGTYVGATQMGGEGAQWIGMAPFTDTTHFIQNVGDGTFFHSGSLALRAAIAAGVNVTFKILFNAHVAMTGGQEVEGERSVADLTRLLEAEGVRRTIVTTEDSSRYRGVSLAKSAELWGRERLLEAQQELAAVPGVTVLVHDQRCAAEARRQRKRGLLEDPRRRVVINQRVCEGCGDCGEKSNCLSVQPVDTEFGRKTAIDQPSCNKDFSCLDGDCPSFLTVEPRHSGTPRPTAAPSLDVELPLPEAKVPSDDFTVRMPGIGGTGVVTVSQIVGMAGRLDRRHVWGLDQTGLSQKAGPVVSDVRISTTPIDGANKATAGAVDLYLALDVLTASDATNLRTLDPARSIAVVSTSQVPTGAMAARPDLPFPSVGDLVGAIAQRTRAQEMVTLDAQALALALFDDTLQANLIALGAAFQAGALPLSLGSVEQAIRLNGRDAERNLLAFSWGRAAVADGDRVGRMLDSRRPSRPAAKHERRSEALLEPLATDGELRRALGVRVPDLIDYQGVDYARAYVAVVGRVLDAERSRAPGARGLAEAVAFHLHKLMAYKDEYEVARLHLDPAERARVTAMFGPDARVSLHLHPPLLRALGLRRKLRLGRWFWPALYLLRAGRRVRGTPLDPFGRARVRRVERELIDEYRELADWICERLDASNHAAAVELAELADCVRGYEDIKLRNVETYRERVRDARTRMQLSADAPPAR